MEKNRRNIVPFSGDRYSIWKFRIRALLSEANVIEVIDNDVPTKISDVWKEKERVAKGLIVEYLSDSFLGFAKSEYTAKEILINLDSIYERKSLASQLAVRKKLLNLKLKIEDSVLKHFTVFDDLITELIAAGGKIDEMDKISHLLLTMPPSYDGVITAIETLVDNNLTLAFVKTRLLDQEIKIKNDSKDTSVKVLQAVSQINKTNNKINKKTEFKSFKNNNNKKKNFKKIMKCYHCGRNGHLRKDCYYYKQNKQQDDQKANKSAQVVERNENIGFAFMIGHKVLNNEQKIKFVLDSGASDHLINDENMFDQYVDLTPPIKILVAKNNVFITATKRGIVKLLTNNQVPIILEDVLYCEEVPYNLISVRKIQNSGMTVEFNNNGISIRKNSKVIMINKTTENLPVVEFKNMKKHFNVNITNKNEYDLWHQRLGHIGKAKFSEIKNYKMFSDIEKIKNIIPSSDICEACILGKQASKKYQIVKNKEHVKRPLFIIHTDVCGPITPTTVNEKNYFVIFIDQFTHYCVTYLLSKKSEVFFMFKDYVNKCEAHFNSKIVNLYCDNGKEYLSKDMKQYCIEKGITYHLTVPYSPQLNGVSERMIRTLTEKARTMVHFAKLDKIFWGEAVLTATYLINRSPSNALLKEKKTPYELWHNRKPELKYLKVFGSTVYVLNKTRRDKFEEKSWKGILVGYESNGYKIWKVETSKFEIARDVVVDEKNFNISRPDETTINEIVENKNEKTINEIVENKNEKTINEIVEKRSDKGPDDIVIKNVNNTEDEKSSSHESDHENEDDVGLRRSKRIKLLPSISYKSFNSYLLSIGSLISNIPTSFEEVKNSIDKIEWEKAIDEELSSHLQNQTWYIVNRPKDKNIIDCKWVFTIKNDECGKPIRYKARLVARGFTQQYLTDYDETYAPVARITSFRFILAFANRYNLLVHHMDVKTAFLNGILKEEIYMTIPQGLKLDNTKVCKLNKAIYGLKQAARCWFEVFDQAMKEKGFVNSEVDHCIYTLDNGDINKNLYVLLYVDDLVIVARSQKVLFEFKEYLKSKFQMKDLGEIKYFIGIKIERNNNKMSLSQSAYIRKVLEKFNMSECKSVNSPLPSKLNYEALNADEDDNKPCRNVIGCLMYIMICTRPDLSTCVNILSRYSNKTNKELWQNLKRVLRYLKGTIDLKLVYETNDSNEILIGYVDSDWGGNDINDRKSTTGYLFRMFDKSTISWNTKRQLSVATSSTEAEYMALFEAVKEAVWLKALAKSILIDIDKPIKIFEDNQGCINIANNPACHKKTKHIEIKYHYTREKIQNNIIKIEYIPTDSQLADVLTKPLCAGRFMQLTKDIGLA